MVNRNSSKPRLRLGRLGLLILIVCIPTLLIAGEVRNQRLNRALIAAIKAGDGPLTLRLLAEGATGDAQDGDDGFRSIGSAARSLLNRLLGRHPSGGDKDHPVALALFYSQCERQPLSLEYHLPVVDEKVPLALAESGGHVNARTPSGNTLLHEAVQFHHHDVVRYLVDHGADIHAVDMHDSVPVLMGADAQDAALLISKGADENAKTDYGQSALGAAGADGQDAAALYEIAHGATLNARNGQGDTPILSAASGCSLETIQAMARAGANIRDVDMNGSTTLMNSVQNKDSRVLAWLLRQGIDVNGRDSIKETALHIACVNGKDAVALKLLEYHPDLKIRDKDGRTALILAATRCRLETVQAMVRSGARLKDADFFGSNSLMHSVENPDPRVFDWMLTQGFDLKAKDKDGRTVMGKLADYVFLAQNQGGDEARFMRNINQLQKLGVAKDMRVSWDKP